MVTPVRIGIPGTTQFLDGTTVTQTTGPAIREGVFLADPTTLDARASVLNSTANPDAYGLSTRNIDMSFDAFNRLRVSTPDAQFAAFNEYKINPFNWITNVSGTGTATHSTTTKIVTLATGGTASGAQAIMQSRSYLRYIPGKSLFPMMTFVMGATPSANVAKRAGYYDNSNGLYLEWTSTGKRFVRRSSVSGSVVNTSYEQADWNVDPLNGSGPSGLTLDLTMGQIFWIDFQFLGVGTVRFGFEINGKLYVCHQLQHANLTSTQPYIATANLPLRYEIVNTGTAGATATMGCICGKVDSEGGFEPQGFQFSASNGATGITTSTTLKPILSIRPGLTFGGIANRAWLIPQHANVFATGTQDHYYQIIWNATLTGASWTAVNATYAMAEYDVSSTVVSLGSGIVVEEGYLPAGSGKAGMSTAELFNDRPLTTNFDASASDTLTIAMRTLTGAGVGYGNMVWHGHV